ncbi:MAG: biotin--[acetyl-CoA-carboxylase] ligase, partial [Chthoniobacteraceae bacterium]
ELAQSATSLAIAEGRPIDRAALATSILRELNDSLPALTDSFQDVVAEAERRNFLIGRWIQVQVGGELMQGIAERLDEHGQLLLRREDGACHPLNAGEVTLRVA